MGRLGRRLEERFPIAPRFLRVIPADERDMVELAYGRSQARESALAAQRAYRMRRHDDERIGLLRRLLPVVDAVDRLATGTGESGADGAGETLLANHLRGLAALRKRLLLLLAREGVRPIKSLGEPVDLDCHDVVDLVGEGEGSSAIVIEERERGYRLGERVLRDAKVVAARMTPPSSETGRESQSVSAVQPGVKGSLEGGNP